MAKQKRKSRHHYVPVLYLKNFADAGGALHVIHLETGKRFHVSPDGIGFQRDFYLIEDPSEDEDPNLFEEKFVEFEGAASPVIKQVVESRAIPTNLEELRVLFNFIAFQAVRVPTRRKLIAAPIERTRRIIADLLASDRDLYEAEARRSGIDTTQHTFEGQRKFADEYQPRLDNREFVQYAMVMLEAMLPSLAKRNWTVFYSSKPGVGFIVSDQPVTINWADGREVRHYSQIPGHHHLGTEVTIPLSSTVAIMGSFEPFELHDDAMPQYVSGINSRTMNEAMQFIAAAGDDFLLQDGSQIVQSRDLIEYLQARHSIRRKPNR